ncbi:MAG: ATP-binding cassette domain-containing protein [Nitrososphaerota archaeon]
MREQEQETKTKTESQPELDTEPVPEPVLRVENLTAGYYGSTVLNNVSLECGEGITLVIGPNGAGKTTLVKSVTGLLRPVYGSIIFKGKDIHQLQAFNVSMLGISLVPERGRLFDQMTVKDNLEVGFRLSRKRRSKKSFREGLAEVLSVLPELSDKLDRKAARLSGGEQQMVAIGRALITGPELLVMDEPTTGLYPLLVRRLLLKVEEISRGLPILMTEQNVAQVASIAKRVYLLESGCIALQGTPSEIIANERVKSLYLGGK